MTRDVAGMGFRKLEDAYRYLRACNYVPKLRAMHEVVRDPGTGKWTIVLRLKFNADGGVVAKG